MLTFQDFIKLKQQDLFGTDVRKTEYAAVRSILTVIQENLKFVQNQKLKQQLEQLIEELKRKK